MISAIWLLIEMHYVVCFNFLLLWHDSFLGCCSDFALDAAEASAEPGVSTTRSRHWLITVLMKCEGSGNVSGWHGGVSVGQEGGANPKETSGRTQQTYYYCGWFLLWFRNHSQRSGLHAQDLFIILINLINVSNTTNREFLSGVSINWSISWWRNARKKVFPHRT